MPYFQIQEKFSQGCRYDVLRNWPGKLCEVDPETKISRDVTDYYTDYHYYYYYCYYYCYYYFYYYYY